MLIYFKREKLNDSKQKKEFVRHYFSDINLFEGNLKLATVDFWQSNDPIGEIHNILGSSRIKVFPNLCLGGRRNNSDYYDVVGLDTEFIETETLPLIDFIISQGANKLDIVRNPKTGKRFFTVRGTDVTGRVAEKVENEKVEKLSADLSVSWVIPKDGEPSWMVHPKEIKDSKYSNYDLYEKDLNKIEIDHVTYYLGKLEYEKKRFEEARYWFILTYRLFRNVKEKSLVVGYSLLFAAKSSLILSDKKAAKRNFLNPKFKAKYGIDYYNRAFTALDNNCLDFVLYADEHLVRHENESRIERYSYTINDAKSDFLKARRLIQGEVENNEKFNWRAIDAEKSNEFRLITCFLKTYFYEAICDFIQAHYILEDLTSSKKDTDKAALLLFESANTMHSFIALNSHSTGLGRGRVHYDKMFFWRKGVERIKQLRDDNSISWFMDITRYHLLANLGFSISKKEATYWMNISLLKLEMHRSKTKTDYLQKFMERNYNDQPFARIILRGFKDLRSSPLTLRNRCDYHQLYFEYQNCEIIPYGLLSTIDFQFHEAQVYFLNKNYDQCIMTLNNHLKLISGGESDPYSMKDIYDWSSYYTLDERAFSQIIETFYLKSKCEFKLNNLIKSFIDLNEAIELKRYIRSKYSISLNKKLTGQISYLKKVLLIQIGYTPKDKDFSDCYYQMATSGYESLKHKLFKPKNNAKLNLAERKLSDIIANFIYPLNYDANWLDEAWEIVFFLEKHSEFGRRRRGVKSMIEDCYDFSRKLRNTIWAEKHETESYSSDWRDILGDDEAGAAYWNLD